MDLKGKAAIVTGGTRGVGRATARALAARGCDVAINYSKSAGAAEAVVAELEQAGVRALAVAADVADDPQVRALVDQVGSAFGRLDYLVNNAGTTVFCDHRELDGWSVDDFTRLMAVNALGPFQCARAAAELLAAGEGGAIVNVGSIAGLRGMGSSIPYCMSKAALHNLTLSLARVFAPRVRVNAVAPGFIEGEWLQQGLGAAYDQVKAGFAQRTPLARVSQPEDVAASILALLVDNPMVTGQVIAIEGGFLL